MTHQSSLKQFIGKMILAFGGLLSVFEPLIAIPSYFRLRRDILAGMPWVVENLRPLITPYLPDERLVSNGYTAAMVQVSGFSLIVYRQARQARYDDSFSISSPYDPGKTFAFGVAEAAVLKLEGVPPLRVKEYDSIPAVDQALQHLSGFLKARLSCELLGQTRAAIEELLKDEMLKATIPH